MNMLELVTRHPECFTESELPCSLRGLWWCLMREREQLEHAIAQPLRIQRLPLPEMRKAA